MLENQGRAWQGSMVEAGTDLRRIGEGTSSCPIRRAYPVVGGRRGSPRGLWKTWAGPGGRLGGCSTRVMGERMLQRSGPELSVK